MGGFCPGVVVFHLQHYPGCQLQLLVLLVLDLQCLGLVLVAARVGKLKGEAGLDPVLPVGLVWAAAQQAGQLRGGAGLHSVLPDQVPVDLAAVQLAGVVLKGVPDQLVED